MCERPVDACWSPGDLNEGSRHFHSKYSESLLIPEQTRWVGNTHRSISVSVFVGSKIESLYALRLVEAPTISAA